MCTQERCAIWMILMIIFVLTPLLILRAKLRPFNKIGTQLAISSILVRSLDYTKPGIIGRLVQKGGPWMFCDSDITDANFPVSGEGVVDVRYRILSGEDLQRADGYVYNDDVDTAFARENMRRCNPAEALLVPAENHQIGRPLVILLSDSDRAFEVDEIDGQHGLRRTINDGWNANAYFLGVCR